MIDELFKNYLDLARDRNRRVSTLFLGESRFNNYLKPWYGDADMATVSVEEHQSFLRSLREKGKSPALRNRIRSLLHVMFSTAIKTRAFGGLFKFNPFQSIEPSKEAEHIVAFWSKEEKDTFLHKNQESFHYPLFLFLLYTGVRIGEAFGVHAEQIHRANQLFMVDRQLATYENRMVHETKGRKTRAIYLIDDVMRVLDPIPTSGLLFKTPQGFPMHYANFYNRIFPEACKKANVKNIGPHGTRHTFAAHYMMDGGNLWDLSKILGHSSIEVTEKRYGHFDLAHVKSRMKIIERVDNVVRAKFG